MIILGDVSKALLEAQDIIHALDGIDLEDDLAIENGRAYAASVSRDLLRLADLLATSSTLVREQYWHVKGYGSPFRKESP